MAQSAISVGFQQVFTTISVTAQSGQHVIAQGSSSILVTLPATPTPSIGAEVRITNSATNQVTVVSTAQIWGAGASGVTLFSLGNTVGITTVSFVWTGTYWFVMTYIAPDTGWVNLTLPTNWSVPGSYLHPMYRLTGNQVRLRGALQNNTGASTTPAMTVPTSTNTAPCIFPCSLNASTFTPGVIQSGNTFTTINVIPNGSLITIDSVQYYLS